MEVFVKFTLLRDFNQLCLLCQYKVQLFETFAGKEPLGNAIILEGPESSHHDSQGSLKISGKFPSNPRLS